MEEACDLLPSLCKDEVTIREESFLAFLRERKLPVMWMKWPYTTIRRDDAKVFFFLHKSFCTILYIYILHLVILQTLLSKATYNWGIHKVFHLEEANRQRKCPLHQVSGIVQINTS